MTLLTIVQDACDIIGLERPTAVVGGSDQNVARMFSLANREGNELARRFDWQKLTDEHRFTVSTSDENQGSLPVNFDRFIDDTFWNLSQSRPVTGPVSQEDWQALTATTGAGASDMWSVSQDTIRIKPAPTVGDLYSVLFISKYWAIGDAGQADRFLTDEDTPRLSEEVVTLGVIWRFLQTTGMDYGEARQTYERALAREMARDGGRTRLHFGDTAMSGSGLTVPDSNWNL